MRTGNRHYHHTDEVTYRRIRAKGIRPGDLLHGRKVAKVVWTSDPRGEVLVRYEDGPTGLCYYHTPAYRPMKDKA